MSAAQATLPQRTSKPKRRSRDGNNVLAGVAAWIIGILFVIPVAWTLLNGLHSEFDAASSPPKIFAPLTLENFAKVLGFTGGKNAAVPLTNSAIAAVASTLLVICFALPAAYATSVKPVRKPKDVMTFFLSTKFLPAVAGLLPLFLFGKMIGALDSIGYLIILYTVMNLPIAVWMLRSFLAEIPFEIMEAAELDGASLLRTLRHVVLPIAAPGIAATSLICVIFSWNELLIARTLTGVFAGTAPVFLAGFVTSQGLFLAQVSAACIVVSLPVLIAGFAAQDHLVQGLSLGAVK